MDAEAREPVDEHDGDGLVALDLAGLLLVRPDGDVEQLLVEPAQLLAHAQVVALDQEGEG